MAPFNKHRISLTRVEAILGLMACISLILIVIPKDWITHSLEIFPKDRPTTISSDVYAQGNSEARWLDESERHWECILGPKFISPFCSMQVRMVSETGAGINLERFNKMTVWIRYSGDGDHVRLYLRNRHPHYYQAGNDTSTKYNVVEIPVAGLENGINLNLSDFGVADWWLVQQKIPLEYSHTEFNDVVYFELQTGSTSRSGRHEFQLGKIVFEGSLVDDETLYKGIVIAWSVFIFGLLLYRIIRLKVELDRNQNYQNELVSINKLLNLQNKQFEDLAKTDQLTGLLNRIGIRDVLYDGLNDWKGRRKPFSMIMIDVDHFKKVNDNYGHDVGDEILKAVSGLFKVNVRQTDFLARWGGEEFILVCPGTDLGNAQVVAESLRKKLADASIHPEFPVTASFGVASLSEPNLDHLFKCADEALYDAKHQGRNRVAVKY